MKGPWASRNVSSRRTVVDSVVLGWATGLLSQVGVATILEVTPRTRLPEQVSPDWVGTLSLVAAVGEMFANAFVATLPSRAAPVPLASRILFGAAGAVLLASTRNRPVAIAGIAGATSAALSAKVAYETRARLSAHIPDPAVGLAENVLAVGLSMVATRR